MKVEISERIYKKLKKIDSEKIEKKLLGFAAQLSEEGFSSISKGFFAMKIHHTKNRYKVRVNIKDRIIFEYRDPDTLCFLDYCNHDEQIRSAERICNEFVSAEINKTQYKEDAIDKVIGQELLDDAEKLINLGDLEAALDKYKISGAKNKRLKIEKALTLKEALSKYVEFGNAKCSLVFCGKVIRKDTIQRVLNRIYSEQRLVIGPYFRYRKYSFSLPIYIKKEYKNITEYNKEIAAQIFNQINFSPDYFTIECFFIINDEVLNEKKHIKYFDADNRIDYDNQDFDYLTINEFHVQDYLNELRELEMKNQTKIAAENLDFIFGNK